MGTLISLDTNQERALATFLKTVPRGTQFVVVVPTAGHNFSVVVEGVPSPTIQSIARLRAGRDVGLYLQQFNVSVERYVAGGNAIPLKGMDKEATEADLLVEWNLLYKSWKPVGAGCGYTVRDLQLLSAEIGHDTSKAIIVISHERHFFRLRRALRRLGYKHVCCVPSGELDYVVRAKDYLFDALANLITLLDPLWSGSGWLSRKAREQADVRWKLAIEKARKIE